VSSGELSWRTPRPSTTNGSPRYSEEVADAGNMTASNIFLPQYFGGNGRGADNCVADGALANLTLRFGRGTWVDPHCLTRRLDQGAFLLAGQAAIDQCNELPQPSFEEITACWGDYPHLAGHSGVGGIVCLCSPQTMKLLTWPIDARRSIQSWEPHLLPPSRLARSLVVEVAADGPGASAEGKLAVLIPFTLA
jgi:hypothetical protein